MSELTEKQLADDEKLCKGFAGEFTCCGVTVIQNYEDDEHLLCVAEDNHLAEHIADYFNKLPQYIAEVRALREEVERIKAKLYTTHAGRELLMAVHMGFSGKTYEQLVEEMESSGNWVEYDED